MSRELQFTEIERGLDYIKFTVEVVEKEMSRELTDPEIKKILGQYDPWQDAPAYILDFARAVIAADRALRVPTYDKTELNAFVQDLYDRKMQEGKHGHFETLFHCVHQAISRVGSDKP